jgi:quercetin dioxygenase-like cupin family protein
MLGSTRVRLFRQCVGALVLVISVCMLAAGLASSKDEKSEGRSQIDADALVAMLQNFDKVEQQKHPWGWLRWLMNDKLDPKAQMTFGLVQINAGQENPLHVHPNCEEQLYMLTGSCEHRIGDQMVVLKAGDLLRIPTGVPHAAKVLGDKPIQAVIVYSSGDRQFVLVDENE